MGARVKNVYVLDTNVLIRFLVGDNKEQLKQAARWFRSAEEGEMKITVHSLVVAEACFVLESFYKLPRKDIVLAMQIFLSQRFLNVPERDVLLQIWDHYQNGLHFVDSFLAQLAEQSDKIILTFDKSLLKKQVKKSDI